MKTETKVSKHRQHYLPLNSERKFFKNLFIAHVKTAVNKFVTCISRVVDP